MTSTELNGFTEACSNLVGQVAANPLLADSIIIALETGIVTITSGPLAISKVLRGAPGGHYLQEFLRVWGSSAPHLNALEVTAMLKSSLACYRLALSRAHNVDAVWTGPDVHRSEMRRTEAVVKEIVANSKVELLIVGYWLVTNTEQIKSLIESLIQKSRCGIKVRFVFDPNEKSGGPDNFSALNKLWPTDLKGSPREVYSWSEHMAKVISKSGHQYDRKLHAKVIISDSTDALVTSANLTHAGILENLEIGLRVQGYMARALVRHFDLLIEENILERRMLI